MRSLAIVIVRQLLRLEYSRCAVVEADEDDWRILWLRVDSLPFDASRRSWTLVGERTAIDITKEATAAAPAAAAAIQASKCGIALASWCPGFALRGRNVVVENLDLAV